jgi:hypothetical protein
MSGKRKRASYGTFSQNKAGETYERLCALMAPGHDHSQIDALLAQHQKSAGDVSHAPTQDLVCCPRAYEESYLREPVGSERPCARGKACEGMSLLVSSHFVLREFLYPGAKEGDAKSLCLLCRREEVSNAYYRLETGSDIVTGGVTLSDHYNLVGVPGEYDVRDCIVSSGKYTGLPLPVVLHVRSAFKAYESNGVRCLSQARLRYPDDAAEESRGPFLGRRATLDEKVAPSKTSPTAESSS